MRVFDFDHAIVREPGRSVASGLRADASAVPDFAKVRAEHTTYVAVLKDAGLAVDILPPLEAFPDSVFVEDPALVFPEGAILLKPGAPSRRGEAEPMCEALQRHFERVLVLQGDEYADGGDILVTPNVVFIGLSKRTNPQGAKAVTKHLASLGRQTCVAETPPPILHFKTAVSLLGEETVLVTRQMAASGLFANFHTILVPDGEKAAANTLRLNDTVLLGDCYPRTRDLLAKEGFAVKALPVTEIGKLDAGLSCMSLRWAKR